MRSGSLRGGSCHEDPDPDDDLTFLEIYYEDDEDDEDDLKLRILTIAGSRFWIAFESLLDHSWNTFGTLLEHLWSTVGALLEHFWSTCHL
eukprot:6249971-Heterocapsa_arctica.AAC.1